MPSMLVNVQQFPVKFWGSQDMPGGGMVPRSFRTPAKKPRITSASPIEEAFARAELMAAHHHQRCKSCDVAGPPSVIEVGSPRSSTAARRTETEPVVNSPEHRMNVSKYAMDQTHQVVSTLAQRRQVLKWMMQTVETQGDKLLYSKAVDRFPSIFKSRTRQANIAKVMDWWRKRDSIRQAERGATVISGLRKPGRVRANRKCLQGRGRPPSEMVIWLYPTLLEEFDRLRKAGLKFDAPLLRQVAIKQFTNPTAPFDVRSANAAGDLLVSKITPRWVQVFMEKHQIVLRSHTGKRQVCKEKQMQIEREVASHLGQLKRDFLNGNLDENAVENIDETHFVIDFDNGKTLGFVGEKQVKYADVVSGGEGMTMVVRISGGAGGYIHPPMMIFTNANRSYPIRGVADKVDGVCYRTGPKGWMDKRLFREYLNERRAMNAGPRGRKKAIFLDNCSGHLDEPECCSELERLNASLHYLPPNATDLCQPADSLVIAKIKDVWSRMWNEKKIDLIEGDEWQNKVRKDGTYSGKLKNPGKEFFLKLAAAAVKEANKKRDNNGINYARKAMMRCGLSLGVDGTWSTEQLFPHLQEIVRKYPLEFAGKDIAKEDDNREDEIPKPASTPDVIEEALV